MGLLNLAPVAKGGVNSEVWPEGDHGCRVFVKPGRNLSSWIPVISSLTGTGKRFAAEDVTAQSEKALLILKCYNLLGYDALGIGDDDLSLGKDFLVDLSKNAGFPFISSNLMDQETGQALFQTHVIKEKGGLRIGIFSLALPVFLFRRIGSKNQRNRVSRAP